MVASTELVRTVTHKLVAMAMDELAKEETKKQVREGVVEPLIRILHTQLMPYLLMLMVIIIAILLMSMITMALSLLFYFRRA